MIYWMRHVYRCGAIRLKFNWKLLLMAMPLLRAHDRLADLVGTSRETITRVVKELKDEGWLEQEGKRYLVPSADAES